MNYNNDVGVVPDYVQVASGSQFENFKIIIPVFPAIGFTDTVVGSFTIPEDFSKERNFTDTPFFIKFTHWLQYSPNSSGGLFAYRIYKRGDLSWTNEYAYYTTGNGNEFVNPISGYNGATTSWLLEPGQVYDIHLMIAYANWILLDGAVEIEFNYNTK